jgi:3D (Asp-Asp-Asp) domain-containing protein
LQEAIKATKKANRVVAAGLKKLSERTIAIDKRVVRLETLVEVARSQPSNLAITE